MRLSVSMLILLLCAKVVHSQNIISEKPSINYTLIGSEKEPPLIICDDQDYALVRRVCDLLDSDWLDVTGGSPFVTYSLNASSKNAIIVGTTHSRIIQQLVKEKKIQVDQIKDKWEAFQITTVTSPTSRIKNAIVIIGSDKRGVAYGAFELSRQMGVSPWYWWADVPVKKKKEVHIKKGNHVFGPPSVKYRGIFINDEAPALSGWTKEKFGGFNHLFYEKVFELILRLKGNYLWPAMWGNAFYDDDSLNKQTADDYGIVIGTSHHEPLMRAHDEWRRYGKGKWDYDSNEVRLKEFWKGGMERAKGSEIIASVGMRGDGDRPMTQGTAIQLLERIVKDQRNIIEEVTAKPASATPQLWALYKEVQDYYDKGMRVPDDVTLLLCDDNWGNIRKLPKLTDQKRKGGYGIYYHFDYVGGPRNYKWINTNNIARVWEQMHLAYEYGVDKIWIVNVGDIKPMEFPISFFLDYAWNTKAWNEDNLRDYYTKWAEEQFGSSYAEDIGEVIRKYSQFNARRKPELLSSDTYSLTNYDEARRVVDEYNDLLFTAEKVDAELPAEYKDSYFQLVLHPVMASANLNQLYLSVALNRRAASQNWNNVNMLAEKSKNLYEKDSLITLQYHKIANGKWNHMMDQTHIGYTYWQQPPVNRMPQVKYAKADSLSATEMIYEGDYDSTIVETAVSTTVAKGNVFTERNGYVSIEAEHWTRSVNGPNIKWKIIPDIGRTASGVSTFPVTTSITLEANSPHLQYEFHSYDSGTVKLHLYFSPTLNFHNDDGLKFAVSIDGEEPQIIALNQEDNNVRTWEGWVANNIIIKTSTHQINKAGKHVLKYWMISPAIVLQKLVVDFGGVKPSYLGPPETKNPN